MIVDKLSRPVRDLRISVTDRCNFRCTYCMPEDAPGYTFLPRNKILTFEEIARIVKLYVKFGVRKIRLTGGEPLLRAELEKLIILLAKVPGIEEIALTTNGYLLDKKAQLLKDAGLNRITVSLDTLDAFLFKRLAGKHLELNHVMQGLEAAARVGFKPIKLNTVVQKGVNDHEIINLVEFARANGYIIRFIEYMDVGNINGWKMQEVMAAKEIVKVISSTYPLQPVERNYRSEVANRYVFADGCGEFGIIASVSQPFCGECSRVRLSADGKIYTCLFGTAGFDIKERMRNGASDDDLSQMLVSNWQVRTDRYSEERSLQKESAKNKIEMHQIGG